MSEKLSVYHRACFRSYNNVSDSKQGMVPRAELANALAEVRAGKDDAQAKAGDLLALEGQLHRVQEQLRVARAECCDLQAALSAGVSRSELDAARLKVVEADARALAAREELQERLNEWELEESKLRTALQV